MKIALEHVKKIHGERTVLDVGRLTISSGALFGVIGENGAGKSTMLNIISGIEPPTSGKVYYGEKRAERPDAKKITLVSQQPYLLQTTVEKNIGYPLKLRNWEEKSIRARVDELIELFGLDQVRKQKGWKLSAGEGQKVSLARAVSFYPEALLLDEPTANIDPGTTGEIERILKTYNQEAKATIVIITHNLAQAKRLCGEAAFLHRGVLLEQGTSEKLLGAPKHPLTAQFIAGERI